MMERESKPWWRGVPFARHWRIYVGVKLLVLALALVITLRLMDVI